MKLSLLISGILAATAAANTLVLDYSEAFIQKQKQRQLGLNRASIQGRQSAGTTENEFLEGGCRDVIFIFARGSTQDGNIVSALPLLYPIYKLHWLTMRGFTIG